VKYYITYGFSNIALTSRHMYTTLKSIEPNEPKPFQMHYENYADFERQKEEHIERIKASKRDYTFKYNKLNYKTLKYTVDEVFKKVCA
jgi:hypothetical protein